ncbi:hypothetical protein MRX96_010968 [Rhipicephalus microplus]
MQQAQKIGERSLAAQCRAKSLPCFGRIFLLCFPGLSAWLKVCSRWKWSRAHELPFCPPTCHRYIVCQFAAAKAGLTLVPINDRCHIHELDSALKRASCRVLLVGRGFKKQDYSQWAQDLAGEHRAPLSLERYPSLKYIISLDNTAESRSVMGFSELLSLGQGHASRLSSASPDLHSAASMLHSSGSTGIPKIIPLSHFNLVNAVHLFRHMTGFEAEVRNNFCGKK